MCFRMSDYGVYEVFEVDDMGFVFTEIYGHLLDAYASGFTEARIFIRSRLAHSYLVRWMPGWVRRAPPGGVWRDSQGNMHDYNSKSDFGFSLIF